MRGHTPPHNVAGVDQPGSGHEPNQAQQDPQHGPQADAEDLVPHGDGTDGAHPDETRTRLTAADADADADADA
jgi:hypothetical protein